MIYRTYNKYIFFGILVLEFIIHNVLFVHALLNVLATLHLSCVYACVYTIGIYIWLIKKYKKFILIYQLWHA